MSATNNTMLSLQVAAARAIEDWSDIRVRGYLKEHPDAVAHRVELLAEMVEELRAAVAQDRQAGQCPPLGDAAAEEHMDEVAEFAAHTCGCGYCLAGSLGPLEAA